MTGAEAAAILNAVKASGTLVHVEPVDFIQILKRGDRLVVVIARGGVFKKHYQYLTSYKGLAFFTKSQSPLVLPRHVETISARTIWMPG